MPTRTVVEDQGYDSATFSWDKITHSLEPEIEVLPEEDQRYFSSKIKLLLGKEIRLSNIPKEFIFVYIRWADWIITLNRYPMVVNQEFIRSEIAKLLNRYGIRISQDGLGWKFGPMGFQQQHVKQEIIGPKETQKI